MFNMIRTLETFYVLKQSIFEAVSLLPTQWDISLWNFKSKFKILIQTKLKIIYTAQKLLVSTSKLQNIEIK